MLCSFFLDNNKAQHCVGYDVCEAKCNEASQGRLDFEECASLQVVWSMKEDGANSMDIIRQLMRDQKRNCESLRFNSLFNEFSQNTSAASAGQKVDEGFSPIKDIEGEARFRTSKVVQQASHALEKEPKGVWATLGKPYVCLGHPIEIKASACRRKLQSGKQRNGRKTSTPDPIVQPLIRVSQSDLTATRASMLRKQKQRISSRFPSEELLQVTSRREKAKITHAFEFLRGAPAEDFTAAEKATVSKSRIKDWFTSAQIEHRNDTSDDQVNNIDATTKLILPDKNLQEPSNLFEDFENNEFLSPFTLNWVHSLDQVRRNANFALQKSLLDRKNSQVTVLESVLITECCVQFIMDSIALQSFVKSAPLHSNELPVDSWTKTLHSQDHLKTQLTSKSFKLGSLPTVETDALERFYLDLCRLIYTLSKGDPDLLFIIQTVKELLENGHSLTRVFLGKIVQETGKFMRDCGRAEYNANLLPVFSYISRCTSTGIAELNQMLVAGGMLELVYTKQQTDDFGIGLQRIVRYGRSTLDLF